jgi:hypothetical protein
LIVVAGTLRDRFGRRLYRVPADGWIVEEVRPRAPASTPPGETEIAAARARGSRL